MNRKAFIQTMTRGGILAAMAILAGVFLTRRQISVEQECGINFQCRSCSGLKGCQLPEAKKVRGDEKG